MTPLSSIKVKAAVLALASSFFAPIAATKGGGVGFWLEGIVSNVRSNGDYIQLSVTGRLWLNQFPDGKPPGQQVDFECPAGIAATLRQAPKFFAMSADWRGGALRPAGNLHEILKTAEKRGNVVKFQLIWPRIDFAGANCPALTSEVIRATDVDLK